MWFLGICVVFGFYYNYVLLEPILWTLFGVLFSYVALYPLKVKVVKALVYTFIPSDPKPEVADEDDHANHLTGIVMKAFGHYFYWTSRVFVFCVVPSVGDAPSNLYFSVLYRLMFAHLYSRAVVRYFPGTTGLLLKIFAVVSIVVIVGHILHQLRQSVLAAKRKKMKRDKSPPPEGPSNGFTQRVLQLQDHMKEVYKWFRSFLARLILPHAHLIGALVVLLGALAVIGSLIAWTVYAFSDEVVYMYRNIAGVVRMINAYLSHFASYTLYVDKAYQAASDWISSAVMADSASAKSRDLYHFISFVAGHQKQLSSFAPIASSSLGVTAASAAVTLATSTCLNLTQAIQADDLVQQLCKLEIVSRIPHLGNATRVFVSAVNQDLDVFLDNPYSVVDSLWELTDYYHDELQSGGTISKGGDYLLIGLNYLKEIILRSGSISLNALGSGVSIFAFLFDSALQAIIYLTLLFILLQSNVGFYRYTAVLLHFVDPSSMLYRSIHKALRAILISSVKMAVFHAGFVWLLYSYSDSPLVCIPTIIAFILGLVPVMSPVIVAAIPLPIFAYAHGQNVWAIIILSACFVVWWSVGTAIYAEIPDSSVMMTTFSVGLGISLFGPRGVIIGPAIAIIPFALYGLGSQYISSRSGGRGTHHLQMRLNSTPRAGDQLRRRKKGARKNSDNGNISSDGGGSSISLGTRSLENLIVGDDRKQVFEFIMNSTKD